MNPVHHSSHNLMLVGNGENVRNVTATLLNNEDGTFNSIATMWQPSPEELELLAKGGVVTLYIMSTQHPPVWLAVNHG